MTRPWPIPAKTAERQRKASDPDWSAWVHANAGSGKTFVLAQRVARLLLNGADPAKILCLTFTKAAAANMSLRVFSILSRWTELADDELRQNIEALGFADFANLDIARRLFARAVETPGGLKIQTIHAFCERILHLFPFEANAPAHFDPLDEQRQKQLLEEARAKVLRDIAASGDSELSRAIRIVASETSGKSFEALLREADGMRAAVGAASGMQANGFEAALREKFEMRNGENVESLQHAILQEGINFERWKVILNALDSSSEKDKGFAAHYRSSLAATSIEQKIEHYQKLFLSSGKPRKDNKGKFFTKNIAADIQADFSEEFHRVASLIERLNAARMIRKSVAFLQIADAVMANYTRLKQINGLLDFEDLIERTKNLLTRSDAAWVLYKLDAGIDHILVDEAQDTSPQQWSILKSLVSDFFTGESARAVHRTFFAVGDEKQSIFSFQGAAPREFGLNAKIFDAQIKGAKLNFENVKLEVSFRSTETIIKSVDKVFSVPENYSGLQVDDNVGTVHDTWKKTLPGLVEIWEPIEQGEKTEPEDWQMPLDAMSERSPPALLASRIAATIKQLLNPDAREAVHDDNGVMRAMRAGDIMILVRRRNAFFDAIIKALKVAGVPVAGADRLSLTDHIAIMDLVAAGRAALLPEDDFNLACLLKSPLFGFDDDDLLRLAPNRKMSIFAALAQSGIERDQAAHTRISRWSGLARSSGPFPFYANLLGAERGRHDILARLGAEAGDAIDEFLRLALQWDADHPASLTSFLQSLSGADVQIKRDMEAAGESVRVMTVHASKGLEAKVVFLPDTCAALSHHHDPKLLKLPIPGGGHIPVWRASKTASAALVDEHMENWRTEQDQEYRRLLYVAMTRAEERLYVSGYLGGNKQKSRNWYDMIFETLGPEAESLPAPWGEGVIHRIGGVPLLPESSAPETAQEKRQAPDWLFVPAPLEIAPAPPLRPSKAIDAADQLELSPGQAPSRRKLAILEGNLCHALLQFLPAQPAENRWAAALRFLNARGQAITTERREMLADQALRVMADPALAPIFAADARAEVAIAGRVRRTKGDDIEIAGRIDRLGQTETEVIIADFKTGFPPSAQALQPQYVLQMALYRAVLQSLFPGKAIRALIVWTATAGIMEITAEQMGAALQTIGA